MCCNGVRLGLRERGRCDSRDGCGGARGVGGNALHSGAVGGILLCRAKTEADRDRRVDVIHHRVVQMSHFLLQSTLVKGTDLLQEDHRILCQSHVLGVNIDVGGQACFAHA